MENDSGASWFLVSTFYFDFALHTTISSDSFVKAGCKLHLYCPTELNNLWVSLNIFFSKLSYTCAFHISDTRNLLSRWRWQLRACDGRKMRAWGRWPTAALPYPSICSMLAIYCPISISIWFLCCGSSLVRLINNSSKDVNGMRHIYFLLFLYLSVQTES
jgi:hypothetical protein